MYRTDPSLQASTTHSWWKYKRLRWGGSGKHCQVSTEKSNKITGRQDLDMGKKRTTNQTDTTQTLPSTSGEDSSEMQRAQELKYCTWFRNQKGSWLFTCSQHVKTTETKSKRKLKSEITKKFSIFLYVCCQLKRLPFNAWPCHKEHLDSQLFT